MKKRRSGSPGADGAITVNGETPSALAWVNSHAWLSAFWHVFLTQEGIMNSKWKWLGWMALGLVAPTAAVVAQDAPAVARPSVNAQSNSKIYVCGDSYLDVLPGEYYACRAKYNFQRNHNKLAVERLRDAAHWANKDAQYALGLIYFNGDMPDVPANRPLALAWLALAAERRSDTLHVETYAKVRKMSSPQDIEAAGKLWKKMVLEYGDKVAGVRALREFNRGIRPLDEDSNYGGFVITGFSPFPESTWMVVNRLHAIADHAFDGLQGTVTVGALTAENRQRPMPDAAQSK
jgi:hypothetical protein